MPATGEAMEGRLGKAVARLESAVHPAAIVLFGSRSRSAPNPGDFDLGIITGRESVDPFELVALRGDLEEILGSHVDLVHLDAASPILRMEVLRHHRVLACNDPETFETFRARTPIEYIDLKRVRQPIERALLATRPS